MASITAFQCINTAFLLCVSLFRGHNFREDYRKLGTSYLKESNINQFEEILSPIVGELIIANVKMPVTVINSSLETCGVGYACLERNLGDHQFYPIGAP